MQDLLHCILKLHFKDVREDEYTPSYGGSSTRMDFLLKNEKIVIEVKKTNERLSDKEIGEQLILEVAYYKNHPNCSFLKCFVYDPENRVKNSAQSNANTQNLCNVAPTSIKKLRGLMDVNGKRNPICFISYFPFLITSLFQLSHFKCKR